MGDLDAAAQLVKIEIEGMTCILKIAGTMSAKAAQAFLELIGKPIGRTAKNKVIDRWNEHKGKKLDKINGEVPKKDFMKKYAGDSISLISLHDKDVDMFLDMCSKEGVAVVRLPDFNEKDGKTQFMVAASTSQTIAFNFERIDEHHIKNGTYTEKCGGEMTPEEYVQTAPGDTPEEKLQNFKNQVNEKFPSSGKSDLKNIDLSSNDKIMKFVQNAATDEKSVIYGIAGYEKIPLDDSRVVGESKDTISILTADDEQIDIDKHLVVNEKGKNYVYCPNDDKAKFGMVQTAGKNITAEELKQKLYPAKEEKTVGSKLPEELSKAVGNAKETLKAVHQRK